MNEKDNLFSVLALNLFCVNAFAARLEVTNPDLIKAYVEAVELAYEPVTFNCKTTSGHPTDFTHSTPTLFDGATIYADAEGGEPFIEFDKRVTQKLPDGADLNLRTNLYITASSDRTKIVSYRLDEFSLGNDQDLVSPSMTWNMIGSYTCTAK